MPNAGWLMCPISIVWEMAGEPALRQAGNLYLVGTAAQREDLRSTWSHAAINLGLLWAKRPAQFDYNQITLWDEADPWVCHDALPASVPNNIQIVARPDRPPQSRICADVLRFRVVLNKARKHQIRVPGVRRLHRPEALHEIAHRQVPKVIFHLQIQLDSPLRRSPVQIVPPLRQVPVEEGSEPGGSSKLQRTVLARLRFQAPASEVIGAGRDHHAWSNLKRCHQRFSVRIPVELETIPRFEAQIDRRHEIFPGFDDAFGVRIAHVVVLEEFLPYPAERPVLGRTRLIVATGRGAPHARARQETQQWFEAVTVLVDTGGTVPKVIGIIDFESPPQFASRTNVALRGGAPGSYEKVLVAPKLRSSPHGVHTDQSILSQAFWIAVCENRPDAEILIEIVRHAARKQIGAGNQWRMQPEFWRYFCRNRGFTGLHVKQSEVPFSYPPVQFHSRVDGNLRAAQQSNSPAEERNELRRILASNSQAEIVLVGPFEKERPLLRKEQRKAREIDLPSIHFRLSEIRVGSEHRYELGRDFPRHVAAGRTLPRPMA